MPATDTEIDDVCGAFYAARRVWTALEKAAARTLIEHHGWTASRAAYIADWLDKDAFWRGAAPALPAVLKNVAQITEKSGADNCAPGNRQAWQAYQPYEDPAGPEAAQAVEQSNAAKRHAAQQPWLDLIAEAHAKGLRGPAMARWVFQERERLTGQKGIAVAASRLLDGLVRDAGIGDAMKAPRSAARTDVPLHWSETNDAPRETAEEWAE